MKYTVVNNRGDEIVVSAQTEEQARERAMRAFWGPPDNRVTFEPYRGQGLIVNQID